MNRKRRNRRRCIVICLLAILIGTFLYLRLVIAPLVRELAKARVSNRASYIINEATEALMESEEIDYDRIIHLEKNVDGAITALKTNINEVNRLKTQILSVVDSMLLELDVNAIGVPLGSLLLPEFFSGSGPKLPVKVVSISMSDADFRNVFSEAGINQTTHRIMMDVQITMTVLTPVGTETVDAVSSVLVAETVIVGSVPNSYVRVEGMESIYGSKERNTTADADAGVSQP